MFWKTIVFLDHKSIHFVILFSYVIFFSSLKLQKNVIFSEGQINSYLKEKVQSKIEPHVHKLTMIRKSRKLLGGEGMNLSETDSWRWRMFNFAFKGMTTNKERSKNRRGPIYKIALPECTGEVHMCIFWRQL